MDIKASIMSMFNGATTAPVTPATPGATTGPATPGNIPANTSTTGVVTDGAAPNGVLPGTPTEPATPLEEFKDLWQPVVVDPNAPAKPDGSFGEVDPKKLMEAASKIDFTKIATPEMMTAISAGGEAATQAMLQLVNKVAQQGYAQSSYAATKIAELASKRTREAILAELPAHITKNSVNSDLLQENPIFTNPAVQPLLTAVQAQMQVKYPTATPAELKAQTKRYIESLGLSIAPKPAATAAQKASAAETDWSKEFGLE